ncbi:MAG: HAD family phosphatase [Actinobacteria bacterium]|nr:HAD family phosphatase [Actinomycetota bacterium]
MTSDDTRPTALLVDWGGVLTTDLATAMSAWSDAEDLEADHFSEVMRRWFGESGEAEARINPVHALERGEVEVPHFEAELAAALSEVAGKPVTSEGLLSRLFEHFRHAPDMAALVRRAREAGITTALLSNSWGDFYPMHLFDGMFDELVISGHVGMRKPDPKIFMYTATLVRTPPRKCVFVDDLAHNVTAAARLGFLAIQHTNYERTADELSLLFGVDLRR